MPKKTPNHSKCEINYSDFFWAIVLIALGIFFGLHTLGIFNLAVWPSFIYYWPVFLILAGVAFLFKKRGIGWTLIIATVILGMMSGWTAIAQSCGEERTVVQNVSMGNEIQNLDVSLNFGAGEVVINKGNNDYIYYNRIHTSDEKDPSLDYEKSGSDAGLSIKRSGGCFLGNHAKETWDIKLAPNISKNLNLKYGASSLKADLRELNVDNLEINAGASSTEIVFDKHSTNVKIDMGASDIKFAFPKSTGVKITMDVGATSDNLKDLEEFVKTGDSYYTKNYNSAENKIEIKIDAGASSIESSFY